MPCACGPSSSTRTIPPTLARFWADVLDWKIFYEADDEVVIAQGRQDVSRASCSCRCPRRRRSRTGCTSTSSPTTSDAEVERLVGARRAHASTSVRATTGWVVLADPEGNEFCVLSAREGGM